MSPAELMKRVFEEEASITFPIKVNHLPDEPNSLIVVNDRPNAVDGRAMSTGRTYYHSSIQTIVRASNYTEAYTQAKIVYDFLDTIYLKELTVDSVLYTIQCATKQGTIASLGLDSKLRRSLLSLNFIICHKSVGV